MKILIDNETPYVYDTPCAYIAIYESDKQSVNVCLSECNIKIIRPLKLNIFPCNNFNIDTSSKAIIELNDEKPIFIFTYKTEKVNKSDYTYYFEKGEHTPPEIYLNSNESVYVEYGAAVQVHINAEKAQNIKIGGHGIIDTGKIGAKKHRMLKFIECNNIEIKDVTLLGAIDWCIVPIASKDVNINNVNIVTWEVNGDGIDVVSSKNVSADNCFIYATDDCISIKATAYDDERGLADVRDVRISNCIFWNTVPGNVMEIGFETRCAEISNVIFENCDVLHCEYEGWQSGGVFTIHNGDRADVHDVVYRNICVEDASQKLFDMKVYRSHYSKDTERGHIYNIKAENIDVLCEQLPPSIFRGCDNAHGIKNVVISNLRHNGVKKNSLLEAHIIAESGSSVVFS